VSSGYLKDDDRVYSSTPGYSWTATLSSRDRNVNSNQRHDTFVFVQANTSATWHYDLPITGMMAH
jgi:hypothetical protein